MQTLDNAQCSQWLGARGDADKDADRVTFVEGFVFLPNIHNRMFHIDTDADTQVLLTERLTRWLQGTEVFLWMTSWATCQEREADAFVAFRRRYGHEGWLMETPGHRFDTTKPAEVDLLARTLLFMTAFNWKGFVLQSTRACAVRMGDEVVETHTTLARKEEEVASIMSDLDFQEWQGPGWLNRGA